MGRQGWQMPIKVFAVQKGKIVPPPPHTALGNFLSHCITTFILLFKVYKAKFLSHKFFLLLYTYLCTWFSNIVRDSATYIKNDLELN